MIVSLPGCWEDTLCLVGIEEVSASRYVNLWDKSWEGKIRH